MMLKKQKIIPLVMLLLVYTLLFSISTYAARLNKRKLNLSVGYSDTFDVYSNDSDAAGWEDNEHIEEGNPEETNSDEFIISDNVVFMEVIVARKAYTYKEF